MNTDKSIENREKEIFDEAQAKQAGLAKKLLLGIFAGMGFVFAVLGIVLIYVIKELGITFLAMGLFMIALGIILFFAIPTKYNYEKYKMCTKKYGVVNIFEINAKIAELEARIEELEKDKKI
ncbi:MAG: hypothetical protein K2M64_04315 [Clostridia bacterium]|nr:hypothetical protein [Clostridia bacterium]